MNQKLKDTLGFFMAKRATEQGGFTITQIVNDLYEHCQAKSLPKPTVSDIFDHVTELEEYTVKDHYWRFDLE